MRGERLQIDPPSQESTKKEILDLKPYMARMKVAFQERIKPSLASERTFAESIDQIGHEAQILALMAEEIGSPRYSYAEEELYQEYVGMLRTGARALSESAARGDFSQTTSASTAIQKSCTACHDDFRD